MSISYCYNPLKLSYEKRLPNKAASFVCVHALLSSNNLSDKLTRELILSGCVNKILFNIRSADYSLSVLLVHVSKGTSCYELVRLLTLLI